MKPSTRRWGKIALLGLLSVLPGLTATVRVDIAAGSTADSLLALAQAMGFEILFPYRELSAARSNALHGEFEPDAAVAELLRDTNYVFTRNATGKYLVIRAPTIVRWVRGVVLASDTGEPAPAARVHVDGASYATGTAADGSFVLSFPAGSHALIVEAAGYRPLRLANVDATGDRPTDVGTLTLEPAADDLQSLEPVVVEATAGEIVALQSFVVTPSRYSLTEDRQPVAASLTATDLQALPQLGEDLYRAISHLPGLTADDFTARFWVRGADHREVLARFDGVDLIEPFHLKDIDSTLSIVDLTTISSMDLCTGGFTAEYGGHLAGVLTMETDSHVRAVPRTTLALSLTGARAAVRAASRDGRARLLVSARSGFPKVAVDLTRSDNVIQPRYFDFAGKYEFDLSPRQRVSVHALSARDNLRMRDRAGPAVDSRYGSDTFWARWQGEFSDRLQVETVLSTTNFDSRRTATGTLNGPYAVALSDDRSYRFIALRQDWEAKAGERLVWHAGWEAKSGAADYTYHATRERPSVQEGVSTTVQDIRDLIVRPSGSSTGVHASVRVRPFEALAIEAGLRRDSDSYAHAVTTTPRLNAAFVLGPRTTIRAAWGIYSQPQAPNELSVPDGESSFHSAERAVHTVVALEHRFGHGVNVRVEGYERATSRLRPHWENVVDAMPSLPEFGNDRIEIDAVRGRARGVELIAEQRNRAPWAWSLSYALAEAKETLRNGVVVPRPRDQRHTFYADVNYTPSPAWQFSAAWQFHTGWPATPMVYTETPLNSGAEAVFWQPGAWYSERLPVYHRLDLRVQRRLRYRAGELRLYVDIFNVYGRRNVLGYRYDVTIDPLGRLNVSRRDDHNLFPMLPSIGAIWEF